MESSPQQLCQTWEWDHGMLMPNSGLLFALFKIYNTLNVIVNWFDLFLKFFFRGMLHSNPMDYAWGANGLDAIITQVLHLTGLYHSF